MVDAVKKYSGVDFDEVQTLEEAQERSPRRTTSQFEARHKKGDILNLFFEEYCRGAPDPADVRHGSPGGDLAADQEASPTNPDYVERFELFINGWEMCNAYSELNDPIDQRARFARAGRAGCARGDEEANHTDEDFLNALEIGMPPTGGIGYGIDRLCHAAYRFRRHPRRTAFPDNEAAGL